MNGKKRSFCKSDFEKAMGTTGLSPSEARTIFSVMAQRIPVCIAFLSEGAFLPRAQTQAYIALISERARRLGLT